VGVSKEPQEVLQVIDMKYRITGKIKLKQEKNFSKQMEAVNERMATHKIYSFFGNVYRLPRNKITIEEVKKIE